MRKYRTMVLAAGLLLTAATPVFAQAAGGEGLRVLPQRHYLIHATVRFRHIGAVPGDVVRTRRRLLPESVAWQRRRSVRLRAECPQDVRLRTPSPEIARGARSRGRDEDQRQSKRRTPAVGYDARRFASTFRRASDMAVQDRSRGYPCAKPNKWSAATYAKR
jgi:hypothetical protein